MNYDIDENPTFQRYYAIWRSNPSSVVFALLAEMLNHHRHFEEAITVCKKGLEKNPELVSGHIALSRAYFGVKNYRKAKDEAEKVLKLLPEHPEALEILGISEQKVCIAEHPIPIVPHSVFVEPPKPPRAVRSLKLKPKRPAEGENIEASELDPSGDKRFATVTMAEMFAGQGNVAKAREIYENILKNDPNNARAREGLEKWLKY